MHTPTDISHQNQIGKIIVIEGSDGTGKETQAKMLKENLEKLGHTVGTLSFPRYTSDRKSVV